MKKQICAIALILLSTAACATTTAPRPQFPDVQLPTGLTYQPDRSVVIESPSVKAAQLVYRSRLEPQSLGDAMRARLEANGWRPLSRTSAAADGMRQVYEKDGHALETHIYEGWWFTYLTVSAAETLQQATAGTATVPAPTAAVQDQERVTRPATASLDASATPAAPAVRDQPVRSDATFTDRVKHFFTNLFSW
jgi:hypothetical protein